MKLVQAANVVTVLLTDNFTKKRDILASHKKQSAVDVGI
jgi:hypothetical protein